MGPDRAVEIGLVVYPGVQMAAVLGMTDVLTFADGLPRCGGTRRPHTGLRVSHWRCEAGAPRRVFDTAPGSAGAPALLVLPPAPEAPGPAAETRAYAAWLCERHRAGTALGAICKGVFLLGETGLLAGRRVAAHPSYEAEFRSRCPEARVDAACPIVEDGDIITVGGAMAWSDLALRLIDRFLGPPVMIATARAFEAAVPGRGAAAPPTHGDAAVLRVQQWLDATQAREVALAALVARSGLEERTFLRRFRRATGVTAAEYCRRLRVDRACDLLRSGTLSADQVAWEVGYADPGAFRKVFARIVGLSPAAYRRALRA
ncbi:GlxA family transcriptional regulator [Methylobacterium sp. JK268]